MKTSSNRWHRVIVRYTDKDKAVKWLEDMNIAADWIDFNNDYFNQDMNTIQFIFNENENSDLTCATSFAKLFSAYPNEELRTYEI